jgi:N-acyl homoserine lactone hydrolase
MKIHAIQTGTVQIHQRQRTGEGRGTLRFVRTLLDDRWTEPLPIYAWAIEHPEGVIVVDTGETAKAGEPGYFPRWHPYFRVALRERVLPHEEIGPRLRSLGIPPQLVRWVVMTHLHTDHAGGLGHFSHTEILVSRAEHAAASGRRGRLRGYLPNRWPAGFEPRLVDLEVGRDLDSRAIALTRSGDVRLVATPGHSRGHLSVLVDEGPRSILLAGDASYTQSHLVAGVLDGVASLGGGLRAAAATLDRIRGYAASRPTVYLPSHDPDSGRRLAEREAVVLAAEPDASPATAA